MTAIQQTVNVGSWRDLKFSEELGNVSNVPDPVIEADWQPCPLWGDRQAISVDRLEGALLIVWPD